VAHDTVEEEGVVEGDVLAHQEFAGFLSSESAHECGDVVDTGVSVAENLLRVFILILVDSKQLVLLGDFSLKSGEIGFIVDLDSNVGLGHASSFVGSDGHEPSPVISGVVDSVLNVSTVGSLQLLVDGAHVEDSKVSRAFAEGVELSSFDSGALNSDTTLLHLIHENLPDHVPVSLSLVSVDFLQRNEDTRTSVHVGDDSDNRHSANSIHKGFQCSAVFPESSVYCLVRIRLRVVVRRCDILRDLVFHKARVEC